MLKPFEIFLIAVSAMMALVAFLVITARCCGYGGGPQGNRTGGDDGGPLHAAGGIIDLETGGGDEGAPVLVDGSGGDSGWAGGNGAGDGAGWGGGDGGGWAGGNGGDGGGWGGGAGGGDGGGGGYGGGAC